MEQYRRRTEVLARKESAFVGVDVHKESWFVTVIAGGVVVWRGRIEPTYSHLRRLFDRLPECEIQVAYEAGPCGFDLYDSVENDNIRCTVVAPSLVAVQPGKRVKVDRIDSLKLARDLADGRLTPIFVFTPEQRAHRDLLRTRQQLVEHRGDVMRQIKSRLLFHGIRVASRKGWSREYIATLRSLEYPFPALRTAIVVLVDLVEYLSAQLAPLDKQIKALSETEAYGRDTELLKTVPGIALLTAMIILTELGDLSRFESCDQLAAFLGLTPSEYSSGDTIHKGRITRCGNSRVRKALVESSWTLIRYDPAMRRKFEQLARRRGSKRAIVAIARILSGRIRHILLSGERYAAIA